ncbi:SpaH/EbpB family LPXTG-anchored major pilin [Corynebacterium sp. HS2168-gen11]|uniref:SpaH/EbpB family LPXTG-anchored major pilin n=1 Tax=Corynebacterium sp. HS2168-gen11 TaxID=2974027 RepID=UPI00216AF446|nr:SpaH/EbpB family LPXTG-anchored major pilin [Corynebacterium sp. HS2168-gen11]MCS4536428.1 SpaH/EbpB family LPXTG-anchored major pilin [Corynebacterium sp. HS2168-gen11]
MMNKQKFLSVIFTLALLHPAPSLAEAPLSATLIDANHDASLEIHKSVGDPTTAYGDPANPLATQTRAPIEGVNFKIRKINDIDLSRNEGWEQLEAVKIWQFFPGGEREHQLGLTYAATTQQDGAARFPSLPVGAYFVEEDPSSAQAQGLSLVSPFVITVPSTNETRTEWDYHVVAFAKDQKLTGQMQTPQCVDPGQSFGMEVTASLPAPDSDLSIEKFEISIPLEQHQEIVLGSSEVALLRSHDKVLVQKLNRHDYQVELASQNVAKLRLTASGLAKVAKLRANNPDIVLRWNIQSVMHQERSRFDMVGFLTTPGYPEYSRETHYGVKTSAASIAMPCASTTQPPAVPHCLGSTCEESTPANKGHAPLLQRITRLAHTGANSWSSALLGFMLILLSVVFIRRSREERSSC